jgi:hypothetical protein
MRLDRLRHGHTLRHRLFFRVVRLVSGMTPPDVLKLLRYRPEYFGRPYSALVQEVLRGPSAWSVGERELFAAFVSAQNQCRF